MVVISKHTYRFKREGAADFVLPSSPRPQSAPDDLRNDRYFQLAKQDGSIVEIEVVKAEEPAKPEAPAPELPKPKAQRVKKAE